MLESHHYPQVSQALLHRASLAAILQSPIVREHAGHFLGELGKVVYALRSFRNRRVSRHSGVYPLSKAPAGENDL